MTNTFTGQIEALPNLVITLEDVEENLIGLIPESWLCVDCGFNTAPRLHNRIEMEKAIEAAKARGQWGGDNGIEQTIDNKSEVYTVRDAVWRAAGMEAGCLCIGCLEKRLGRRLNPKDFQRNHPLNWVGTGTPRLIRRRKRP